MRFDFPLFNQTNPASCIGGMVMKIDRLISKIYRKHLAEFDITNSQLSILFFISKKGTTKQSEIAAVLFFEKSSVSRNLKRLILKSWIQRGHAKEVTITSEGLELLENLIPSWNNAMEELKSILGEDGFKAVSLLFNKLTHQAC